MQKILRSLKGVAVLFESIPNYPSRRSLCQAFYNSKKFRCPRVAQGFLNSSSNFKKWSSHIRWHANSLKCTQQWYFHHTGQGQLAFAAPSLHALNASAMLCVFYLLMNSLRPYDSVHIFNAIFTAYVLLFCRPSNVVENAHIFAWLKS